MHLVDGAQHLWTAAEQRVAGVDFQCDRLRNATGRRDPLVDGEPGKGRNTARMEECLEEQRRIGEAAIDVGGIGGWRLG
jgi:hypothetical protein